MALQDSFPQYNVQNFQVLILAEIAFNNSSKEKSDLSWRSKKKLIPEGFSFLTSFGLKRREEERKKERRIRTFRPGSYTCADTMI